MSAKPLLLNGQIDTTEAFAAALGKMQQRIDELENELSVAHSEVLQARQSSARAVSKLRKQLGPLYGALKEIFGEIESIGGEDEPSTAAVKKIHPAWESWKQKLEPRAPDLIDLLLTHGEMSREQIRIALSCGWSTADGAIGKLSQAGLLLKPSKGRYRLKDL